MADQYEEMLAGTVALGHLDCTLLEYARGIKYFVEQESRKHNCDTHLINLLRRAACVGWENIYLFKQSPDISFATKTNAATRMRDRCVEKVRELMEYETAGSERRSALIDTVRELQSVTLEGEREKP